MLEGRHSHFKYLSRNPEVNTLILSCIRVNPYSKPSYFTARKRLKNYKNVKEEKSVFSNPNFKNILYNYSLKTKDF